jgi:hypothetical protein
MGNHAPEPASATARRNDAAGRRLVTSDPPQAGQHLTAIAARLAARGVASRLTLLGGTPVLTIDRPGAGPDPVTVTVDPGTSNGSGLPVECTCLWTPIPGTTPEATADTIVTVLDAIRPRTPVTRS